MALMSARKVASFVMHLILVCLAGASALHGSSASAMELVAKGDMIFLVGEIKPGDSITFTHFVAQAPKGTYHYVYLASGGGFIVEAVDIGRVIRREGMATIVDASRSMCASACTAIFASGTQRFYLNSKAIADGKPTKGHVGLGFHDGSSSLSLEGNHYSGDASALMINAYYEFGVPKAADVITKASPDGIFVLSGQTALALGIATSLGKS